MKIIPSLTAAVMSTLLYSATANAQFFQTPAGNDTATAYIDVSSAAVADTSPLGKVLGAFAKAANDNPNDTSSADLTMKALGNLVGGGGVSAADSVAAVKSFKTAKGGNGFFYQYVNTVTTKERGTSSDTSSRYFTSQGEGRSEMNLPAMMGLKGAPALVTLAHADQRQYSLTLDAAQKTYSLNVIDTSLINSGGRLNYQVIKIGNETINGYNCIHAKMTSTFGTGRFSSTTTMDVWTSTEVPGYSMLKSKMTDQHVTPKMMQALDQAGCNGFFVKISDQGKDHSMSMVLLTAQQKNLPATLFQVPAGYTESKENMFSHMMGGRK